MSKQNLTNLTEDIQLKRIHLYIQQRSFHKDQKNTVIATDLIKKFKHNEFLSGVKRIKFFNSLLVKTVTSYAGRFSEYEKLKISIENISSNNFDYGAKKKMKLKKKNY